MSRNKNGTFIWSMVDHKFGFDQSSRYISSHSLVTIQSSEEYVILIGGINDKRKILKNVFKFNGTWSLFGQLKKPRWNHNTIYWNGAVYVIGGEHKLNYNHTTGETKTEIWKIKNSPYRFKTVEKMPILRTWYAPSLFIVSDSFFPNK